MMRKFLAALLVLLLLPVGIVLAYTYEATLSITNNTTTNYGMSAWMVTNNNTYLVDHNYINSSGNDTRVLESGTEIPRMIADTKTLFATPLAAGITKNELYTFGNTPTETMPIITGNGGYFTVSDNTNLEITNNGTMEWSGYLNTTAGANKYLVNHYDVTYGGVQIFVSPTVSQNVTARIITGRITTSANITPNAAGTVTGLTPNVGVNWQCVDDPPSTPDDIATLIYENGATASLVWDSFNLETPSFLGFPDSITINFVTVKYRVYQVGVTGYAKPNISLGSTNTTGTEVGTTTIWTTISENLTRPGGGTWAISDFNNLQVGIGLRNATSDTYCTQIYVQINYSTDIGTDLTVTSIPSGEYLIRFTADGTYNCLSVGSYTSANISVVSIPNSTSNWIFCSANTTPYVNYYKHYVNGVLVAHYQPTSMIIGTNLPDRSVDAISNNATMVWGSNPTGIIVSLSGLTGTGSAPAVSEPGTTPALGPETPGIPTSSVHHPSLIGGSLVQWAVDLWNAVSPYPISLEWVWAILATIVITAIMVGIAFVARSMALPIMSIAAIIVDAIFWKADIVDWITIPLIMLLLIVLNVWVKIHSYN
jgi:hypothetical protein